MQRDGHEALTFASSGTTIRDSDRQDFDRGTTGERAAVILIVLEIGQGGCSTMIETAAEDVFGGEVNCD